MKIMAIDLYISMNTRSVIVQRRYKLIGNGDNAIDKFESELVSVVSTQAATMLVRRKVGKPTQRPDSYDTS